jgi:hypothetical protein
MQEAAMFRANYPDSTAYATVGREVRTAVRRDSAIEQRMSELERAFERPTEAVVTARYTEPLLGLAIVSRDMVGWALETLKDADEVLARTMFDAQARSALIARYVLARATSEIDDPKSLHYLDESECA